MLKKESEKYATLELILLSFSRGPMHAYMWVSQSEIS